MTEKNNTVDPEEIERFSRIASEWWNPEGKFRPLHRLNPVRIAYIRDQACAHFGIDKDRPLPLSGLSVLDIGCGGGLIAEPMARLGAKVTAIDAADKNIAVASLHAQQAGLDIDYRKATAEALLQQPDATAYDMVLALEIIEHVADVEAFIECCAGLVKPGGLIILSTLNRTAKSYALAIIGAEYVLRWLPPGTHDWKKFLRPSELYLPLQRHRIAVREMTGMVMSPLSGVWRLDKNDLSVNYLITGSKNDV